ncbi:LAML3 protein, partial [Bucco capensis]|nr:LAML3 protein [Bucco capensis]
TPLCSPVPSTAPAMSPTKLSRLQEKEELRHLNDRLAAYIERVQVLEAEKSAVRQSLLEKEGNSGRLLGSLRLIYEEKLADARRALNDIANQKAVLRVELGKAVQEHRELHSRESKAEADLNLSQARVRDLDAHLSAKEAELAAALNEKQSLKNELNELKDEAVSMKQLLEDSKKHLHSEMMKIVDLENKKETLQEQLRLEKRLHEDELKKINKDYENRIAKMESACRRRLEEKVLDSLQGLRKQYEEQIQGYKEELERTFHAKTENAQLSAAKHSNFANVAREELKETKLRIDTLTSHINHYKTQNVDLENKIRELQEMLDYERYLHQRRMVEKDKEITQTQQQIQAQLEEYQNLFDVKVALDLEISTYKMILEGEEQRLRLSPSPPSRSTATQATSQGRQLLPGRKRKMQEAKKRVHSAGFKTVQHASSSGNVSIEEIDADGKFVRLKNNSDEDQPLRGWVLRRHLRSVSDATYKFPSGFTLQAGQVVTIWGAAAAVSPGPSDLVWKTQKSWVTGDSVDVSLIGDDGEELAKRKMVHVPAEEGGEEDDDYEETIESETEFPCQAKRRKKKKCCLLS